MIKITYAKDIPTRAGTVLAITGKGHAIKDLPAHWQTTVADAKKVGMLSEKCGDTYCAGLQAVEGGHQNLIVVSLGDTVKLEDEKAKTVGGRTFQKLGYSQEMPIAIWFDRSVTDESAFKFVEGLLLKNYLDAKWKTGDTLDELTKKFFTELVLPTGMSARLRNRLERFLVVIEGIFLARDLVAKPPMELTPAMLADEAVAVAKQFSNLKVSVLNKEGLEKAGLGLLLAVNRGSVHEARLITLTLNANATNKPIVLVGKGVTFDSGGYNIKPSGGMETMHTDMAGAAAVLGTMKTLAALGEKKKVIGIIPSTENLVSGEAYKPSDIVTSLSGKTVEIGNTDAEGRLILADAITYAKQNFEPGTIIDVATLTGACIVALGERYAGIFSNKPSLIESLESASEDSGDKVWHLPLDEGFMDRMKSKIADYSNIAQGSPGAGASTGAAFLAHFAEKTPWAHIDIAGPSHQTKDAEAWNPPSGITGYGVQLLTTLVQKYLK